MVSVLVLVYVLTPHVLSDGNVEWCSLYLYRVVFRAGVIYYILYYTLFFLIYSSLLPLLFLLSSQFPLLLPSSLPPDQPISFKVYVSGLGYVYLCSIVLDVLTPHVLSDGNVEWCSLISMCSCSGFVLMVVGY